MNNGRYLSVLGDFGALRRMTPTKFAEIVRETLDVESRDVYMNELLETVEVGVCLMRPLNLVRLVGGMLARGQEESPLFVTLVAAGLMFAVRHYTFVPMSEEAMLASMDERDEGKSPLAEWALWPGRERDWLLQYFNWMGALMAVGRDGYMSARLYMRVVTRVTEGGGPRQEVRRRAAVFAWMRARATPPEAARSPFTYCLDQAVL